MRKDKQQIPTPLVEIRRLMTLQVANNDKNDHTTGKGKVNICDVT